MTPQEFIELKQIAMKNRVWYVGTVAFCFLVLLIALFLYHPQAVYDGTEVLLKEKQLKAYETLNVALDTQIKSSQKLVKDQQNTIMLLLKRDSAIKSEILLNRQAVENLSRDPVMRKARHLLWKTRMYTRKRTR